METANAAAVDAEANFDTTQAASYAAIVEDALDVVAAKQAAKSAAEATSKPEEVISSRAAWRRRSSAAAEATAREVAKRPVPAETPLPHYQ